MDIYLLLLITVLIICCIYRDLFFDFSPPLTEGFTKKFFENITPNYFVGLDYSQLLGNVFEIMQTITLLIPYNINSVLVNDSIDRYRLLNENKIQFIMSRAHTLYNIIYKTMPGLIDFEIQNLRFVCALYRLPINIFSTALDISEFGQLKNSGLTVNVGSKYSGDYFASMDLFLRYDIIVGIDVFLTYYELIDLNEHYGNDVQVIILGLSHPNLQIANLTAQKLTKFVEIHRFNDGNIYHITPSEEFFYKEHPYYIKTLLEKNKLFKYYPDLVLYDQRFDPLIENPIIVTLSHFINTIGVRYYLLSNKFTDSVLIAQLLYNMKLNMNVINKLEFVDDNLNSASLADFPIPIQTHIGAHEFFTKSGLYTTIGDSSCLLIDGKCDYKQLYEHHLYPDFDLTFDQRYNSDTTNNPYISKSFSQLIIA